MVAIARRNELGGSAVRRATPAGGGVAVRIEVARPRDDIDRQLGIA